VGYSTRKVTCVTEQGFPTSDSHCLDTKPAGVEQCHTKVECRDTSYLADERRERIVERSWVVGDWSEVSIFVIGQKILGLPGDWPKAKTCRPYVHVIGRVGSDFTLSIKCLINL